MGLKEQTESEFGRRVLNERKRREWSQDELARRMTAKGVDTYASTIAKIESERKPRAVRLAEAMVIADLFEVSLDSLLGRSAGANDDLNFTLRALLDSARQAMQQLSVTTGTLNTHMTELNRFDFDGREFLQDGLLQAVESLTRGLSALVQLSTFDLPPDAKGVAPLKEIVDREGAEALAKTLNALEGKDGR